MCLRADDFAFPDMQVFSKCGFTRRQGTVCRDFQTAYLSLRRVQSGFCAELQPTKILSGMQSKGSQKAEKRKCKKAPSGQLGARKCPVYKGFFEPNRGLKGKYTKTPDFGFLTVHRKTKGRFIYGKQTENRGCGNAVIHTDEQNNIHRRQPYSAGRQCHQGKQFCQAKKRLPIK